MDLLHQDLTKNLGLSHHLYEDKAFKNFKSFTFVRHPFMRVVSTYKDKIIDWTNYRDWRKFVGFDKNQPYMVHKSNLICLISL